MNTICLLKVRRQGHSTVREPLKCTRSVLGSCALRPWRDPSRRAVAARMQERCIWRRTTGVPSCKTGPDIVAIASTYLLQTRSSRKPQPSKAPQYVFRQAIRDQLSRPFVLWASSFRSCRRGAASFASRRPRRGPLSVRSRVCSNHGRRGLSSRA
jgi:hypothetical protein